MPNPTTTAIHTLKEALAIAEQIQKLEAELNSVLKRSLAAPEPARKTSSIKTRGKRTISPATIAKMKAAQQARWAKKKGIAVVSALENVVKSTEKVAKKAKRQLSPEGRARIVAALKARWAGKKKA